jgi:tetratricopeptide (TPR) repeat protein
MNITRINDNLKNILAVSLIIILGIAVYSNSWPGKFLWDDLVLIEKNVYIKSISHISDIFTKDIGAGSNRQFNFYRPLQMLIYTLGYYFWGLNPAGYHIINTFLHIAVVLCLYWLLNILYHNHILSLFTGILFISHPIHTQAITYTSSTADPLAALFILLCLIFYIKYSSNGNAKLYIATLLSYLAALLSKENSLIMPVLLLLYHYLFQKKIKIKIFLSLVAITIFYIVFRTVLLRNILPYPLSELNLIQRLPGFFIAITNYIGLLIVPSNLHMDYGYEPFNPVGIKPTLGAGLALLLLFYAFKYGKKHQIVSFAIFWFFLTLLPYSNFYPLNGYMAENWLYLPSVGFFLIVASGLLYLYNTTSLKITSVVLLTSFTIIFACLTIKQNTYWKEPIAFYKRLLGYNSKDPAIYVNLGHEYTRVGKNEDAIRMFKKVLQIDSKHRHVYTNLGVAYFKSGHVDEAIPCFEKAAQINPADAAAYNYLASAYLTKKESSKAIRFFAKALKINPNYADAYGNAGVLYAENGKYKEAIILFKKAIKIDPDNFDAYNNISLTYNNLGMYNESIELLEKVIKNNPGYAAGYNNLAIAHYYKKQYDLAVKYCRQALQLGYKVNPDFLALIEPYFKK